MRLLYKNPPSLRNKLISANIELDRLYENYHHWYSAPPVKLSFFEKCVIVLEDRRFFQHSGVDIWSLAREMSKFLTFRKYGGASTIEMQFIRTVNNRREHTFWRKIREAFLAWLVNYHFNKVAVLRSYLDIAFFGSGLVGASDAALKIFHKSPSELTDRECALLASMLVYPRPLLPPRRWSEKVDKRATYALRLISRLEKRFDEIERSEV